VCKRILLFWYGLGVAEGHQVVRISEIVFKFFLKLFTPFYQEDSLAVSFVFGKNLLAAVICKEQVSVFEVNISSKLFLPYNL